MKYISTAFISLIALASFAQETQPEFKSWAQTPQLFGNHSGDEYIAATIQIDNPRQDVRLRIASSVVRDTSTCDVIIKWVNMLPVEVTPSVKLNGTVLQIKNVL